MTKMRTYNGFKHGEINGNAQGKTQYLLEEKVLVVTTHAPEMLSNGTWRAEYTTKTIFKGDFTYSNGKLEPTQSTISEMGTFSSQINQDGSNTETGFGYNFPKETLFSSVENADDTASKVTFSYSNDASTSWHPISRKLSSFPISSDRSVIKNSGYEKYVPIGWGDDPFSMNERESSSANDNSRDKDNLIISAPTKFNKRSSDKITNFNPSTDTLEIDTDSFGIDNPATFASGKNKKAVKKKLAKLDIDFLYDQKKGGLYFNENGADKGFGDGGIIAILNGAPDLTSDNLEFI